jgi:hypothetical protein
VNKANAADEHFVLDRGEIIAIARFFRNFHSADSFLEAVKNAHILSNDGALHTAAIWREIVEEMSLQETSRTLDTCITQKEES